MSNESSNDSQSRNSSSLNHYTNYSYDIPANMNGTYRRLFRSFGFDGSDNQNGVFDEDDLFHFIFGPDSLSFVTGDSNAPTDDDFSNFRFGFSRGYITSSHGVGYAIFERAAESQHVHGESMMFATLRALTDKSDLAPPDLNKLEPVDLKTLTRTECPICFEPYRDECCYEEMLSNEEILSDNRPFPHDIDDNQGLSSNSSDNSPEISAEDENESGSVLDGYGRDNPHCKLDDLPEHSPVVMPCGHVFGNRCIRQWLSTSNACPLCRKVVKPADGEQDSSSHLSTYFRELGNFFSFVDDFLPD